jgi:transcriptional regulator with XRE-family HTH domain
LEVSLVFVLDEIRHPRLSRRLDDQVGSHIRLRRTHTGMTQQQLAASLGISYPQILTYETGANRVSARRLFEIGQRLGVDVAYFFEGLDATGLSQGMPHGGRNWVAIDLVRNFLEITHEDQRSALANLVKTLKAAPAETAAAS